MSTPTAPAAAPAARTTETLVTPDLVRLSLADLAYFAAAGVAIHTLPHYVTGPVGSDEAGAGLAFGAFAVSALVLRPWAGRWSDRHGRRPLLVGGALLGAVAMLSTAFVETLAAVVLLRVLVGVAEAAFMVASFAALADLAPPSRMGEALSYNSLGLYLGLSLGPPLGEVLVHRTGYLGAWTGAAVLCLVAAGLATRLGETRPAGPVEEAPGGLVHWPAVAPALGFFTSVVAMGGFLAFASLHAAGIGMSSTSVPLFVYGIVVVACRLLFAKVPDRFPPLPLGAAALLGIAAGLLVTATATTPAVLVAGTALLALGITFSTPAFFAAVFATAGPSRRGAASGTAAVFFDLGLGVGPVLLGSVARGAGIPWALAVAAAVALVGSAWTLALARRGGGRGDGTA